MTAIDELQRLYRPAALGLGSIQPCIDWAIARLLRNEEGEDRDIAQLASATCGDEAARLVERILARYPMPQDTTIV